MDGEVSERREGMTFGAILLDFLSFSLQLSSVPSTGPLKLDHMLTSSSVCLSA